MKFSQNCVKSYEIVEAIKLLQTSSYQTSLVFSDFSILTDAVSPRARNAECNKKKKILIGNR